MMVDRATRSSRRAANIVLCLLNMLWLDVAVVVAASGGGGGSLAWLSFL